MSVDPLAPEYPWYTPYQFAGNKPIAAIDLDGLEEEFKYNSQMAIKPMLKVLDGGGSKKDAIKAYNETLAMFNPFRTMPDEAGYIIGAFGGGILILAVGPEAVVAYVVQETAESSFESLTGVPVILDPGDVVEWVGKKGRKMTLEEIRKKAPKVFEGSDRDLRERIISDLKKLANHEMGQLARRRNKLTKTVKSLGNREKELEHIVDKRSKQFGDGEFGAYTDEYEQLEDAKTALQQLKTAREELKDLNDNPNLKVYDALRESFETELKEVNKRLKYENP